MEAIREVRQKIDEGYYPNKEDLQKYRSEKNRDGLKYKLIEKARYLEGKKEMIELGFDLTELEFVTDVLCRGYKLPREYNNRRCKRNLKGSMECHVGQGWFLTYKYEDGNLIFRLLIRNDQSA